MPLDSASFRLTASGQRLKSSTRQSVSRGRTVSDQARSSVFYGDNELMLGTFCQNISGGMVMSTAAKNTLDWRENVAVAQAADGAG
jgi:hypothetical protein